MARSVKHHANSAARKTRPSLSHARLTTAIGLVMAIGLATQAQAQTVPAETGQIGNPDSWVNEEFNADWGLANINAQYAYARGLTGKGIRLGLFDSGVDLKHSDFAGKDANGLVIGDVLADGSICSNTTALSGPDACFFSTGDTVAIDYFDYDEDLVRFLVAIGFLIPEAPEILESIAGARYGTHGTHVAGTMAANRDGNGSHGVAFAADITSARMFSNSYANTEGFLGLPWGTSVGIGPDSSSFVSMYEQMQAQGVRAINHSWGLAQEPTTAEDMDELYYYAGDDGSNAEYFETFVNPSLDNGTLQVWAAGNGYGNIAGIYATLPRYIPELEQYWLSVANLNPDGTIDGSSSICGLSAQWCVTAPGTGITSTVVDGQANATPILDEDGNVIGLDVGPSTPEYGYGDLTGTSMAAPHVTGSLALLMERFPYLDNAQIRDVLLTTTTDLGAPGVDPIYGWGLINLRKAIEGPGLLRVDTNVNMNQRAGGTQVWEGEAWDDWTNDIGGPGKLTKSGIGWLRLSGDNSFGGASVQEGILELDGNNQLAGDVSLDGNAILLVNGTLEGSNLTINQGYGVVNGTVSGGTTTVAAGGTLNGSGTLGDTIVQGTIAPGNSIGTLTIEGNYRQEAGSVYEAELSPPDQSDWLDIRGTATLAGGTLRLNRLNGVYALGQRYRLLTATNGVDGQFAEIDSSQLSPFMALELDYGANAIALDVARGDALTTAAATSNQTSVAASLDAMAIDQPLLQRAVSLFPAEARTAFDTLSGELHASTQALLVQESRVVRDSTLARARTGHDAFTSQTDDNSGVAAWVDVQHASQRLDANSNTARARMDGNTWLAGVDLQLESGWRFGVLGGVGDNTIDVSDRGSRADLDATHAAVYASQQWGGFGLRVGYAYAWQDVETQRRITFTDLQEQPRADYDATTQQAFIEAGYRWTFGNIELEPFAQFAQVRVESEAARERGQLTTLNLSEQKQHTNLSTAGVRFNANLSGSGQDQSWLTLRASLAYRNASRDVDSRRDANWVSGGTSFTVLGAPIAENATLAELGLGARLSQNSLLELGYNGVFASEAQDSGITARFSVQF